MFESGEKAFQNGTTGLAAWVVGAMLFVGCSTPASLPPKIATGLDGLRTEGVTVRGQIQKTTGTLKELMANPQTDLNPQFQSFSHELGVLEDRVGQAQQQRTVTESVVRDQFMAWDKSLKQLKNEESRQLAAIRRSTTEDTYSDIQQKIAELRKKSTPFLTDLRDIRQYLTEDLSKEGLETMNPTAQQVFDQEPSVIKRLDDVIDALNNAIKRN
ncbi:MAG: DUF2959 family protein [Nitrospirales bacterium]|nr:DUF2959 family protein [Nitrospira sp.]MDR4461878.1 DUF2959 family protein [Nitrospirales bacterium]MDR4483915.1 DUF2959 family protein [Nitrospirales bacterium]